VVFLYYQGCAAAFFYGYTVVAQSLSAHWLMVFDKVFVAEAVGVCCFDRLSNQTSFVGEDEF
jgi:hypothetical protein